ncbi:MAG: hypothetical protein KIS91_00265 [Anaerolineae bacterium]|nr:hypothetical protein [Anaerolineae bacterium]
MSSLSDKAQEQARSLAPWAGGLPWWGLLVEGLLAIGAGFLVLLFPSESARNAGMFGVAALGLWGLMQFWWLFRHKFEENIDQWAAARGGIAVFAAALFFLMFYFGILVVNVGLVILGLAGIIWGILGIPMLIGVGRGGRVGITLDSIVFGLVGVAALYVLFQGPTVISTASAIITWVLIIGGVILMLIALLRRRDAARAQAQLQAAQQTASKAVLAASAASAQAGKAGQPSAGSDAKPS